ncbi:DUF3365 domain-containing protein [Desulfococcaceae bacterium HSG7]|nr:DUF3365 domain-containing protein [Desulfococcaceae bacterium HSG7]
MGIFKNSRIFVKIFFLFLIVLLLSVFSHVLVAQKVQQEFLRKQAKSITRQIVLTRQWIAGLGGVWSKDTYTKTHGFLSKYSEPSSDGNATAVFYLHNPALATREISTLADIKHGYNFRVVSDRFREPKNKPDSFESEALKRFQTQKMIYTDGFQDGLYRYTEPLFVKQGCLKCHGKLDKDVKEPMKTILLEKYGPKAFDYKVGDVRGIVSIKIPQQTLVTLLSSIFTVWNVLIGVISILLFYLFTRFMIVKPITQLTHVANKLSEGQIDIDLGASEIKFNTKNEISQLALAFERLRKSFEIMYRKLASR